MIGFIIEMVIGKIVGLFMSQRWFMAIAYSIALLALVASTIGVLAYVVSLWLFRPEDFGKPLTIMLSLGAVTFIVAIWVAFSIVQRREIR